MGKAILFVTFHLLNLNFICCFMAPLLNDRKSLVCVFIIQNKFLKAAPAATFFFTPFVNHLDLTSSVNHVMMQPRTLSHGIRDTAFLHKPK